MERGRWDRGRERERCGWVIVRVDTSYQISFSVALHLLLGLSPKPKPADSAGWSESSQDPPLSNFPALWF